MNTNKFSTILLDKAPKKINNSVENILDTLFNINEVVRELNSIDFCNPLGYILTKALPPDGLVAKKLKKYGNKVSNFVNKVTTKLELNKNNDSLLDDIEELRLSLEELVLPEELKDIIPGADGLTKLIQDLNDSLVITNTLLTVNNKAVLIKSFSNRLIPLTNPSSLAEVLLSNKADNINKTLNGIIKPERFRKDLLKLIKLVNRIDKSIKQIQSVVILMNKIIKSINVLIKIFKISIKLLKKIPIPAKYVTVGMTNTSASKVSKFEIDINDLEKLLNNVSKFLSSSIIKQISRIRIEIFTLLVGLNQLYENLKSCSFFDNDSLLDNIKSGITILENNIIILDELFPGVNNIYSNLYKGYNIVIIKEETTDNNTSLIRRRVVVTNSQDLVEYESTPTYSNNDQVLIKEGQYYIDLKEGIGTSDNGIDNITDEQAEQLLKQIGMDITNIKDASDKEEQVKQQLYIQIQNNPEDKKLYDSLQDNIINPSPKKVEQIKKIINIISSKYNNQSQQLQLQNRLKQLYNSLLSKDYTPEEIREAYSSSNLEKYGIKIINNNITISKN